MAVLRRVWTAEKPSASKGAELGHGDAVAFADIDAAEEEPERREDAGKFGVVEVKSSDRWELFLAQDKSNNRQFLTSAGNFGERG